MTEKWLEVFKAGTWVDSSGNRRKWTRDDIDKMVSQYAKREDDAPVVIGHPRDNSPAYGWVRDLRRDGDVLLAKVQPTVKEFVSWVNQKLYKNVSISLRLPSLGLRHIGFLGAAAPAVKGLKAPEFAEGEFMEMEIDMSEIQNKEESEMTVEELNAELEKQKAEFAKLEAENTALKKQKKDLEEKGKTQSSEFEELKTNFAASEEELKTVRKNLTKLHLNSRKMEFEQFLNHQIGFASLSEEQKSTAFRIVEILGGTEFAEGGDEPEGVKLFKGFLQKLPDRVKPGEFATQQRAGNPPEGKAAEFEEKVAEYMKENDGVEYQDAAIEVAARHPSLYEAATAT